MITVQDCKKLAEQKGLKVSKKIINHGDLTFLGEKHKTVIVTVGNIQCIWDNAEGGMGTYRLNGVGDGYYVYEAMLKAIDLQ